MFGNPLTLLTLGPIVAGFVFLFLAWASPPSKREEISQYIRILIFAFSLLLLSLSTLMFLESYSGISWTSIGLNNYVYDNCANADVALEAGGCSLIDGFGVSWHVGCGWTFIPNGLVDYTTNSNFNVGSMGCQERCSVPQPHSTNGGSTDWCICLA